MNSSRSRKCTVLGVSLVIVVSMFPTLMCSAQSIDTAFISRPLKIDEEHPDPSQMDRAAVLKLVNWFIRGDCRLGVPAENFEARDPGLFPRKPGARADDCVNNFEYNALLRKRLVELAIGWPEDRAQRVIAGSFDLGMNADMTVAIFGEPHRVHQIRDMNANATEYMQWVYDVGSGSRYLYFKDKIALAMR